MTEIQLTIARHPEPTSAPMKLSLESRMLGWVLWYTLAPSIRNFRQKYYDFNIQILGSTTISIKNYGSGSVSYS
jgi:hypothetical protein